jgi:outer membrane protein TolC
MQRPTLRNRNRLLRAIAWLGGPVLVWASACGCQSFPGQLTAGDRPPLPRDPIAAAAAAPSPVRSASFVTTDRSATADQLDAAAPAAEPQLESVMIHAVVGSDELADLESLAIENSPTLRRMRQEAAAAWAKTQYIARLPDPTLGGMFFIPPMNFEPDRQVADVQLMQMIPWLARLDAEEKRACVEALIAENQFQAERLRVVGDIRANWYRLYVLAKQIETTKADESQLDALINTASARVAAGDAQVGDVLMATLEKTSLREQLIRYQQEVVAASAELNRLVGRDPNHPVLPPISLDVALPDWHPDHLLGVAHESQPEINAARLQTVATRWGIEVARLKRRPDMTLGVGWVAMDAPGSTAPEAGRDSLTLSVATTLPFNRAKYGAMLSEAAREHAAAHATEDEVTIRLDALLRELWAQAQANHQTVMLYQQEVLPQARQVYEADQQALINNAVTFDRVIRDYRTLLNLELGYHRALGELATSLARIRQTVGVDLVEVPALPSP